MEYKHPLRSVRKTKSKSYKSNLNDVPPVFPTDARGRPVDIEKEGRGKKKRSLKDLIEQHEETTQTKKSLQKRKASKNK